MKREKGILPWLPTTSRKNCWNIAYHYGIFVFTYKFKLLAIKLSQTYLVDTMFVLCQSVQQLSTNRTATNFQQSPKHLLSVFLPHFLHTSITTISDEENQACSHCQRKKIYQYLLFYQTNYYEITVGMPALFPSMASFFFRQLAQRKGPSHGFDAGEKKGPEFTDNPSAGAWSTWQTAHRKSPEFVFAGKSLPSLHFHAEEDELRTTTRIRKLKNPLISSLKQDTTSLK